MVRFNKTLCTVLYSCVRKPTQNIIWSYVQGCSCT